MHYYVAIRIVGLCSQVAVESKGASSETACIVHDSGTVWDANCHALNRRIRLGMPLKEAKTILRDDALYVEYRPEDFETLRNSILEPCLNFTDRIEAGLAGEGLLDITSHPRPLEIAGFLFQDLYRKFKCKIVAGIAPS